MRVGNEKSDVALPCYVGRRHGELQKVFLMVNTKPDICISIILVLIVNIHLCSDM